MPKQELIGFGFGTGVVCCAVAIYERAFGVPLLFMFAASIMVVAIPFLLARRKQPEGRSAGEKGSS